jgi:hypothetical protein
MLYCENDDQDVTSRVLIEVGIGEGFGEESADISSGDDPSIISRGVLVISR